MSAARKEGKDLLVKEAIPSHRFFFFFCGLRIFHCFLAGERFVI